MPLLPHERTMIHFLLKHMLLGSFGGVVFAVLLLVLDVAHIRTMLMTSDSPVTIMLLLFSGMIIVFGSVGMGLAVFSLGEDKY